MNTTPVESSHIAEIGYDPEARHLRLVFKNGTIGDHIDVPPEEHEALMASKSKGGHYAKHIKGKHAWRKAEKPA